ncbi:fimbrial protein [Pseudomonas sp. Pseusp97]|uniref:fimbrial protein n=1 Tax=Pseudomonas sp. Pseusp97 TaxID=3243065 RepID=UPI0039A54257
MFKFIVSYIGPVVRVEKFLKASVLNNFLRVFFNSTVSLLLLMVSINSYAACSMLGGWNVPSNITLSGNVSVSPTAANGTVLASYTSAGDKTGYEFVCYSGQSDTFNVGYYSTPLPVSGYSSGIYNTGVSGVGVKVVRGDNGAAIPFSLSVYNKAGANQTLWDSPTPYFKVQFIKTGPIASGLISSANIPLAKAYLGSGPTIFYLVVSGSVNFVVSGCQVSVPNVPLGTHEVSELSSNPYTANPSSFSVSLNNCPQTVPIRYQIDQITGYANQAQSVVNVTGGATGVGVQLLKSDGTTPSPMGSQQLIGSGSLGYTLSFKARYFKTGTTVGAGAANATMGLTLFYQ